MRKYDYCEQVAWNLEQFASLSNEQLIMMALAELLETIPGIDRDKPECRALADALEERGSDASSREQ